MISLHKLAIAIAMVTFCVAGNAQTSVEHDTHHPDAALTDNESMPMRGGPDAQMKAMRVMHDKMMAAKTPEERSALMAEHMKVMQDSMAMMDEMMAEMGRGGMMGKGSMGVMGGMKDKPAKGTGTGGMHDMQGRDPVDGDMDGHRQMMEKRMKMMEKQMQMMQSMMQMMMDRMPQAPDQS